MTIITITTNADGTMLGADETGQLYTGHVDKVGLDQLDIATEVAADGLSYTRTTSYKGTVIGQGVVTKDGFAVAGRGLSLHNAQNEAQAAVDAGGPAWTDKALQTRADEIFEQLWTAEQTITDHQKHYVDMLDANGNVVTVEKTLSVQVWEKKA